MMRGAAKEGRHMQQHSKVILPNLARILFRVSRNSFPCSQAYHALENPRLKTKAFDFALAVSLTLLLAHLN